LKGESAPPPSQAKNIIFRNIDLKCRSFFDVQKSDNYFLSDFTFENLNIEAQSDTEIKGDVIENLAIKNVRINGKELQ
jgi:hypothetical protein